MVKKHSQGCGQGLEYITPVEHSSRGACTTVIKKMVKKLQIWVTHKGKKTQAM